jgi:hypothetical protein
MRSFDASALKCVTANPSVHRCSLFGAPNQNRTTEGIWHPDQVDQRTPREGLY